MPRDHQDPSSRNESLSMRTGVRIERDAHSAEPLRGRTGVNLERGTARPYQPTLRRDSYAPPHTLPDQHRAQDGSSTSASSSGPEHAEPFAEVEPSHSSSSAFAGQASTETTDLASNMGPEMPVPDLHMHGLPPQQQHTSAPATAPAPAPAPATEPARPPTSAFVAAANASTDAIGQGLRNGDQQPSLQPNLSSPSDRPATAATTPDEQAPQSGLAHLVTSMLSRMLGIVPVGDQQTTGAGISAATSRADGADEAGAPALAEAFTRTSAGGRPTTSPLESDGQERGPEDGVTTDQGTAPRGGESRGAAADVLIFRLPFNAPDGTPALLAFHPMPLPHLAAEQQQQQQQPQGEQPQQGDVPGGNALATPAAQQGASTGDASSQAGQQLPPPNAPPAPAPGMEDTGAFPHPAGHVPRAPLFVPLGASPLPFSFIYDAPTSTAWPIAHVVPGVAPGGPTADMPGGMQPHLVAGPPFRILLNVHLGPQPEPERPDPEQARNYVKALELADAELRSRMARLGMGDIGSFASSDGGSDALLGCGICLDNYEEEDRPAWIAGEGSEDEAVVAVPCAGHHTLHAGCLRDWLSKTPPSQWTCPFCRAPLDPLHPEKLAASQTPPSTTGSAAAASSSPESKKRADPSKAITSTLREEVRRRERERGWRCDAPACLARYPAPESATSTSTGVGVGAEAVDPTSSTVTQPTHPPLPDANDAMSTSLVSLAPCRHAVHLDCLCTSMRVEAFDPAEAFLATDDADDPDALETDNDGDGPVGGTAEEVRDDGGAAREDEPPRRSVVGKWVSCPTCRKESWAELPIRKRPVRAAARRSGLSLEGAPEQREDDTVLVDRLV